MTEILELNATDCMHCYKCIRNCPVKAICFSNDQATIVQEECVLCGRCFVSCPQNAKSIHNDLPRAQAFIGGQAPVMASVAPSFVANYPGATIKTMAKALQKLGFAGAEETARGATMVKQHYDKMVNLEEKSVIISTCCHTVNLLVQKHYPQALPYLAPVVSPMQAHGASLKKAHPGCKTIFIGPCISKKSEAEMYPGSVDCVLTFEELDVWLNEAGVQIEAASPTEKGTQGKARLFPTTGGILRTMEKNNPAYTYLALDGMDNCIAALEDISAGNLSNCFIEMSACSGSCIGGPALTQKTSLVRGTMAVNHYAALEDFDILMPSPDELFKNLPFTPVARQRFGGQAIAEVLAKIGKTKPEDELNCGSCGYDTCREKAQAVLEGKANLTMCLPYLMSKAQSFSDTIIRNTPNGIIVLSEAMEIQQINAAACRMLHVNQPADVLGRSVVCVMEPHPFINVLDSGHPIYEHRQFMAEHDRYIRLSVIQDKSYGLIIGIMRDITETEVARASRRELADKTVQVTDEVIGRQMRTVQEIASLLGETAAETQIALTKLKETLQNE